MSTTQQRPSGYWKNFSNVEREMFAFIKAHGSPGVMPTNDELLRAARSDLASAVGKHGGFPSVAGKLRLNLRHAVKRKGYWDDFSNIRREITRFLEAEGKKGLMPTKDELCRRGNSGLARAIQRHGGFGAVAERLGLRLSYSAKPKKYWKDLENLDKELSAFIKKHGRPGVLPSQVTLKQHGRLDLINAIRRHKMSVGSLLPFIIGDGFSQTQSLHTGDTVD